MNEKLQESLATVVDAIMAGANIAGNVYDFIFDYALGM